MHAHACAQRTLFLPRLFIHLAGALVLIAGALAVDAAQTQARADDWEVFVRSGDGFAFGYREFDDHGRRGRGGGRRGGYRGGPGPDYYWDGRGYGQGFRGPGRGHGHAHFYAPPKSFGHGRGYRRGAAGVGRGCHPVWKRGHWRGYPAKVGGTMCYDAYGQGFVVRGSRYLIHYY